MAKALKIGIATPAEMKARTIAIARGELRPGPNDPKVWLPSVETLGKILSGQNQALLARIREAQPATIGELSIAVGRQASNVLRTLRTMERYGLVRLEKGHGRSLRPVVPYSRLDFSLDLSKGGETHVDATAAA